MADYRTETVVTSELPATGMTPLERLLLSQVFELMPEWDARAERVRLEADRRCWFLTL